MDHEISRSEQKRRAKGLEELAGELIGLSPSEIKRLPCSEPLRTEILDTAALKGGARKRQMKHIAKGIRQTTDLEPLFTFLAEQKGSRLKESKQFHELERLRDDIMTEAIEALREGEDREGLLDAGWQGKLIAQAASQYPSLDQQAITTAAISYARSRKPVFNREAFRLLKAAMEQTQRMISQQLPSSSPDHPQQ